jgi:hypothetical protein
VDFLLASRAQVQGLMEKSREIQQESLRNLNSSLEELHSKLSQELDDVSVAFVNETRTRARQETARTLELFDVEASARMSARLDEALEKARGNCDEMERTFAERLEHLSREALNQQVTSVAKELEVKSAAGLKNFRAEVQNSFATLRSKVAAEISDQLQETSARLAEDLQKRADKICEDLGAHLTATVKIVIADIERQIVDLMQSALTTVEQQAEAVQRRTSDFVIRDLRKRLDQFTSALQHLESHDANAESSKP